MTDVECKLSRDWLSKSLEYIEAEVAFTWSPSMCITYGQKVSLPLDKKQADKLYDMMSKRFNEWTGKELKHYKR